MIKQVFNYNFKGLKNFHYIIIIIIDKDFAD